MIYWLFNKSVGEEFYLKYSIGINLNGVVVCICINTGDLSFDQHECLLRGN